MRPIDVNDETVSLIDGKPQFILLGDEKVILDPSNNVVQDVKDKLTGENDDPLAGFWGTLGMNDNSNITWRGELQISREGNVSSDGITLQEVQDIKESGSTEIDANTVVLERFISFKNIQFDALFPPTFTYNDIPKLRLTVMVGKDEGALVFYEFTNATDPANNSLEYILPEHTTDFKTSERDRLTYFFPVIPNSQIVSNEDGTMSLSDITHNTEFVVKILTFKRNNQRVDEKLATKKMIHVDDTKAQLLKYSKESNAFLKVENDVTIDFDVKTLFLIHGTLSTTEKAFNGLYKRSTTADSWLDKQFEKYGQIIAFDHSTVTDNAADNVRNLTQLLGGSFISPVDIITHSRGGLVGKYIAINTPEIPIGKGALVACANGVGYFTAGWKLAKFLSLAKSVAKATGHPISSFITALAQYSCEYYLTMPGFVLMTPDSDPLKQVAAVAPKNIGQTKFMPVVGDFQKSLVEDDKLLKRWFEIGLDELIKLILGSDHDWVVGSKEQFTLYPASYYAGHYDPDGYKSVMIPAFHTTYFDDATCPDVEPKLSTFLA